MPPKARSLRVDGNVPRINKTQRRIVPAFRRSRMLSRSALATSSCHLLLATTLSAAQGDTERSQERVIVRTITDNESTAQYIGDMRNCELSATSMLRSLPQGCVNMLVSAGISVQTAVCQETTEVEEVVSVVSLKPSARWSPITNEVYSKLGLHAQEKWHCAPHEGDMQGCCASMMLQPSPATEPATYRG